MSTGPIFFRRPDCDNSVLDLHAGLQLKDAIYHYLSMPAVFWYLLSIPLDRGSDVLKPPAIGGIMFKRLFIGGAIFKRFFKEEKQVEQLIDQYLDNLKMAQENFLNAMDVYLEKSFCEDLDFLIEETHKVESKADDTRYEIETMMYDKALIPESRGDILGLLEAIDQIPGLFELILYMIQTQRLGTPDFLVLDLKELIRVSLECCDLLIKEVGALFRKSEDIRSLVSMIDNNESQCDHIERRIITRIFDSELDPFQKLQLKEVVIQLGEISDHADRVSRRVYIISTKRRV